MNDPRLIFLIFISIFFSACSDAKDNSLEQAPFVNGLFEFESGGTCNSMQRFSAFLAYGEFDYKLDIFDGGSCDADKKLQSLTVDAEDRVIGEWNTWLIIDSGTSYDSRSLELINPNNKSEKLTIDYIDSPVFNALNIKVFREDEIQNEEVCPAVPIVVGAPPSPQIRTREWVYSYPKLEPNKTDNTRCIPLQ